MRTMGQAVVVGLAAGALWLAGCGSDSSGKGEEDAFELQDLVGDLDLAVPPTGVETVLSTHEVKAGVSFQVQCVLGSEVSQSVETEVSFAGGTPASVLTMAPGEVWLEKKGAYKVACKVKELGIEDGTPEDLVVLTGDFVKLDTTLDKFKIKAGESAVATCTGIDKYGNSEQVMPGVDVVPPEGVAVEGMKLTGQKAGTYEVKCKAAKGVEVVPTSLTVTVGDPAVYKASVVPESVTAGQSATVSCQVEDVVGNVVEAEWVVEAPEGVTVSGTGVSTTKAGEYEISCAPPIPNKDAKLVPAKWTVTPGVVVGMKVYPKPASESYAVGDAVTIKHELVDQYDNVVADAEIEPIVVTPAAGMELQPNKVDKFLFADEGKYKLEVKAKEYPYSGSVELLCDGTGPKITFTYPPRGATLTGPTSLVVTGHVEDKVTGVKSLKVNDNEVAVDGNGDFSAPMVLLHGMNLVSAVAEDGIGNVSKGFISPFYSTAFLPVNPADPSQSFVPQAIPVFLSQAFIDDGDHSQPPDDLATVVEGVMAGFDVAGMLPEEGFAFMEGCTVVITGITYSKPTVQLESVDGGLHVTMNIPDFVGNLTMKCCYEVPVIGEFCNEYYGIIYADAILVDAYLFISVDAAGQVKAELGPIQVDFENLNVDIQGVVGSLFDTLVDFLVSTLKDVLIQQFVGQFGEQLPQMVEEALGKLAEGSEFELPPLIGEGDPIALLLSIRFAVLQFTYDGLFMVLDAAITTEKKVAHEPLGALMRDQCMGSEAEAFVLPWDSEMNAAIAADFVNEALYSIWSGGALNLELTAETLKDIDLTQYGLADLAVTTDFYYAPVLQTCGTGDKLEVQVGDAYLHAQFTMMDQYWDIYIYLFLVLDAVPVVVEEEGVKKISIQAESPKIAEVHIDKVGEDLKGQEQMVEDLFKGVILPMLTEQLLGQLGGFEIPGFDLSSLDPSIPEGTQITVDLEKLYHDHGYLVIGGKLK